MGCTVCNTKESINKNDKNNEITEARKNVLSRVVYHNVKNLTNSNQKLEKEEEDHKTSEMLLALAFSDASIGATQAITLYESSYKDMLGLKLSPIQKYEDIEKIRDKLWDLERNVNRYESAYLSSSDSEYPEEDLLAVRMRVRKMLNDESMDNKGYDSKKESIQSNEFEIDNDLLGKISGKSPDQMFKIIKNEYPDLSDDIIKDIVE